MINLVLVNTQEWIRLKFFQTVIYLSFVFILFSYLLSSLSFSENQRLIVDFGLAGLEISSLLVSIFFSSHVLHKEIERKTILVILSRPISRWKIMISYFLSLALLNSLLILILSTTLLAFVFKSVVLSSYIFSVINILLKSLVIGSVGLFISNSARPLFTVVLVFSYWLLAYSVDDIQYFAKKNQMIDGGWLNYFLNYTVPQFYEFNWKTYAFVRSPAVLKEVLWSIVHLCLWIVFWLYSASYLFKRKQIV